MAEMTNMLKKLEKASGRHNKILDKIEALKQRLAEEEKAMQREQEKVNSKWMKKFAAMAEEKGICAYKLDQAKLVELLSAEPNEFYMHEDEKDMAGLSEDELRSESKVVS